MAHRADKSKDEIKDRLSGFSAWSEDEPMITIGRIPKILEPFVTALRPGFSRPQFRHFGPLLVAYAASFGRRNIDSLYASMQETTCRQKLNDFMVESPWAGDGVLQQAALFALTMMDPKKGERLEILIDGSGKRKRGKATDAVGYIKEAGSSVFVPGHKYLKVALRFRGVILPWTIDIYIPKKFFKTPEGKDLARRMEVPSTPSTRWLPRSWPGCPMNGRASLRSTF